MDDSSLNRNEGTGEISSEISDSRNILVLESATGGDEAICFDLLAGDSPMDNQVLVISLDQSVDEWFQAFRREHGDELPAGTGFVTVDEHRSLSNPETDLVDFEQSIEIEAISNPGNLTDIGVAVTEFLSDWEVNDGQIVVCLRSLTPLLMHSELRSVYQFLFTLTGMIKTNDATAHYHLDPATCDEQTIGTLNTLFDAIIEVDETGDWVISKE